MLDVCGDAWRILSPLWAKRRVHKSLSSDEKGSQERKLENSRLSHLTPSYALCLNGFNFQGVPQGGESICVIIATAYSSIWLESQIPTQSQPIYPCRPFQPSEREKWLIGLALVDLLPPTNLLGTIVPETKDFPWQLAPIFVISWVDC